MLHSGLGPRAATRGGPGRSGGCPTGAGAPRPTRGTFQERLRVFPRVSPTRACDVTSQVSPRPCTPEALAGFWLLARREASWLQARLTRYTQESHIALQAALRRSSWAAPRGCPRPAGAVLALGPAAPATAVRLWKRLRGEAHRAPFTRVRLPR